MKYPTSLTKETNVINLKLNNLLIPFISNHINKKKIN